MTYVVSLSGFVPPARFDTVPWTSVKISEGAVQSGPFNLIDTQAITPDVDPSQPQVRSFTTALAQLPSGWYQVVFYDNGGAQSEASDPVRADGAGDTLPPTPDDIRTVSPLLREKFPLPPTDVYQTLDLRNIVLEATALVQSITWRIIDPTLGCAAPEDYTCEVVPDELVPVAVQAIARMAERIRVTTDPAFAQQVATGRRLRGFNAGQYSESYFAPGEFARRGASQGRPAMDTDDALDAALWALATEDARDYHVWRATGVAPPTGVVSTFDYRRASLGYGSGMAGGWGGGFARGGPDGL